MAKTPNPKQANRRGNYKSRTPSLDEAVKIAKSHRGKNGIYGMLQINDGRVMEVGVYNGNTKKYALFRSDLVDEDALIDIREVIGN